MMAPLCCVTVRTSNTFYSLPTCNVCSVSDKSSVLTKQKCIIADTSCHGGLQIAISWLIKEPFARVVTTG